MILDGIYGWSDYVRVPGKINQLSFLSIHVCLEKSAFND